MIARSRQLLAIHQDKIHRRTDQMFAVFLMAEYAVALAITGIRGFGKGNGLWTGLLGACLFLPSLACVRWRPGRALTRHLVAITQMFLSSLLIQMSGGRIETYFLIFGSLACLSFYRDWRVLLSASVFVVLDTYLRDHYWHQAVYGTLVPAHWHWLEHTGWVLLEDLVLGVACLQNWREMQEIATRRAQIENVAAHLEEAIEARDTFLSICSHELKTPLTSMKLQAQMGKRALDSREAPAFTPEMSRKFYDSTEKQINRLARLVENMLDVSRIGSGRLELSREDVDLAALVKDVVQKHETQLSEAGCGMTLELEAGTLAHCDPFRIEQVLINLITNASKYASGRPVLIRVSRQGTYARLVVKDEGNGISKESQARLFQRFERASSPNGVSGLGLGLYISKSIIDQHGGRISLESATGQGASFTVELTAVVSLEPIPPLNYEVAPLNGLVTGGGPALPVEEARSPA